jgi:ribosomal protein S27AE
MDMDRDANRTLFQPGLVISPECDRCKQASEMASHIFWLWGFGNFKIQAPGSTFYETRWLWEHFCQHDTSLCSRCGTAERMSSRAAQKIEHSWSVWVTGCPPFCILLRWVLHISKRCVHKMLSVKLATQYSTCSYIQLPHHALSS